MSSSSSEAERPGGRLLRRALTALEQESPWHTQALASSLVGLELRVDIDGEALALRSDGSRAMVEPATGSPPRGAVRVRLGLSGALALLEGEATVLRLLETGALTVLGAADPTLAAGRSADIFLHGMVRCASSRALLGELRGAIEARRRSDHAD